jgi:hypothetical protein
MKPLHHHHFNRPLAAAALLLTFGAVLLSQSDAPKESTRTPAAMW